MFLDPRTCDLIPPLPMYWTLSYCLSALSIVNVTSYWLFKRTLLQSYPYVWIRTVWSLQSTKCPCDLDSTSTIHHLHRFDRHSSSTPIFLHLLGISIGVHTFIVTIALRWCVTSRTLSWKPSFFRYLLLGTHISWKLIFYVLVFSMNYSNNFVSLFIILILVDFLRRDIKILKGIYIWQKDMIKVLKGKCSYQKCE